MTSSKPVRMSDIAAELGISLSLVSKVLSGHLGTSSVRPELAASIRETAQRLGYRPNAVSRALSTGRQGAIAVLLAVKHTPGYTERHLRGLSSRLASEGLRLVLHYFESEDDFRAGVKLLSPTLVDGVLIGGPGFVPPSAKQALQKAVESGLPVVSFLGSNPLGPLFPNVGIDQEKVGEMATRHLLERGCRRILFVHVGSQSAVVRERGFHRALSGAEASSGVLHIDDWPQEAERMRAETDAILRAGWDGVVCGSDVGAAALVGSLAYRGLRPPEALRIIGVDDAPFAAFTPVPITSVSGRDLDRSAVALERLLHPSATVLHETLDPVIIVRGTT